MQQPVPGRIALKFVIPLETGCFAVANKIFELYPIWQAVWYIEYLLLYLVFLRKWNKGT